jgi:hypothetical protein
MIVPQALERYDRTNEDQFRALVETTVTPIENARPQHFISADRGDTSLTLNAGTDVNIQRFATALTANRTVTLGSGSLGSWFRVTRTGLGAFTLDVGGLKTIPNSTAAFVDVAHDGTAWRLTAYGVL